MNAVIRSTDQIVKIPFEGREGGVDVPARVWEGITPKGTRFHAFIVFCAVLPTFDNSEFEKELSEQKPDTGQIEEMLKGMRFDIVEQK